MTIEVELTAAAVRFSGRAEGNLGLTFGEPSGAVVANRAALLAALRIGGVAVTRQVHGTTLVAVSDAPAGYLVSAVEADGQLSGRRGVALAVHVADCLPVAIAGAGGVAMLHCGWRGLAGGIIAEAVAALRALDVPGGRLEAAIGPGAGGCCYEAGPEVHDAFAGYGASRGRLLDLPAVARAQLHAAGVAEIQDVAECTICAGPERFFSHRRDGESAGRQAGVAWLR
jgi:YfiH family protein